MRVICVIADIVESRTIQNRQAFQRALGRTLDRVNDGNKQLLSPYTLTLGDEFQAVYKASDRIFRDFSAIQFALHPHKARFSVAVGNLTTPINKRQAIGMDGPAFYQARNGVDELKRSAMLFRVAFDHPEGRAWVNPALDLISASQSGWKKSRFHILHCQLAGDDVKTIAKQLGLSAAAIYKNIRAGALDTVRQLYAEISREINVGLSGK